MTATDELRRLLDERGVEWWSMHDVENGYHQDRDTEFLVYGCKHVAHEWGCRLQVDMLTPEQAITATLGRGTCEYAIKDNMNETEGMGDVWIECSACHCTFDYYGGKWLVNMNYCPYCGAQIERREQ